MLAAQERAMTFEEFFRREYPRLVPMLRALTADLQRAEDLAQDALWKAHQDWERISRYDRPGAWVRRVALNASANVHRRQQRERLALTRIGTAAGAGQERVDELPTEDAELWRHVRALPDQQRFAIVLHYVEDRSVAEIAHVLECSDGAVKTHLSRGRAALARALGTTPTEASS